ncbi:helix-turn-helix domain-containing protein [Conexibacter sp. DBS9H8]|uniref:helix-turn-helix domain-containing protein n=1 Tax=Conexibacter sp. DBS9H8 TaxID=2937801 RepID=UPI00353123B1
MTERLLTPEEVGRLLAVPKSWVYGAARTGQLPAVRLGRYVRFREATIVEWLEKGSSPTVAAAGPTVTSGSQAGGRDEA